MKRLRYYAHLEHYWEQVHTAQRAGQRIDWQYDFLEVRQNGNGTFRIDYPKCLPDDLKHRVSPRVFATEHAAIIRAKTTAKLSTERGVRVHVVNCVPFVNHFTSTTGQGLEPCNE